MDLSSWVRLSPVVSACWPMCLVGPSAIEALKVAAKASSQKRARLCAHKDASDSLHEMIIVLCRGSYVRPHRHLNKSESYHIMEGLAEILLFRDDGQIDDLIRLSPEVPYFRLSHPVYHTIIPRSEIVVVHETTGGPWRQEDTEWAPWAPVEQENE